MISKKLVYADFSSKFQFSDLSLQSCYPSIEIKGKPLSMSQATGSTRCCIISNKLACVVHRLPQSQGSCFIAAIQIQYAFLCTGPPFSKHFKQFQKIIFFQIISINFKNSFFQIISDHFKNSHFANRKAILGECGGRSTKRKNENFKKSRSWKISKVWPWPYNHTLLPSLISHKILEMLDFSWFQRSLFM